MKFFEICAEVLVPKFTRAEVRLSDTDAKFPVNFKVDILELITTILFPFFKFIISIEPFSIVTSARVNIGTRTSAQISKNFINFGTN